MPPLWRRYGTRAEMNTYDCMALERKMIPVDRWGDAPEHAQKLAQEGTDDGIPTGIGKDEKLGWFVICTAGQGPMLVWSEKDI